MTLLKTIKEKKTSLKRAQRRLRILATRYLVLTTRIAGQIRVAKTSTMFTGNPQNAAKDPAVKLTVTCLFTVLSNNC